MGEQPGLGGWNQGRGARFSRLGNRWLKWGHLRGGVCVLAAGIVRRVEDRQHCLWFGDISGRKGTDRRGF